MKTGMGQGAVAVLVGVCTVALAGGSLPASAAGVPPRTHVVTKAAAGVPKNVPWATVGRVTVTPAEVVARARMLALFSPQVAPSQVLSAQNLQVALDELVQDILLTAKVHPKIVPSQENTYVGEVMASLEQSAYPSKNAVLTREHALGIRPAQVTQFLEDMYRLQAAAQTYVGTMPLSYAKQYYEQNRAQFKLPTEEVDVRHILVKTEAEAKAILRQLEHGASFAKLAEKDSLDRASAVRGGNLGWFGPGVMVAPFSKAAFATPVGHYAIVHSQFGWHVLQVLGREKAGTIPPFSQVEQQVISAATPAYDQLRVQEALSRLEKEIRVKFHGVGKNA